MTDLVPGFEHGVEGVVVDVEADVPVCDENAGDFAFFGELCKVGVVFETVFGFSGV